jgi:prepilin-type N-terminal cleavage/methylation domain-containing protein
VVSKQTTRKINDQSGFTIIEVITTLIVMTILLTVVAQIVTLSNASAARTRRYDVANSLAFSKVQEYELKDFDSIPIGTSANNYEVEDFTAAVLANGEATYQTVSATVTSEPRSGSLILLGVIIDYTYGSDSQTIEYSTFIQVGGVGR